MRFNKRRKGMALLFVAALAGLLLLIALFAGVNAVSNINVTAQEKVRTELEFACESGLNRAKAKIEKSFNNNNLNKLEPFITFQGSDIDDTGLSPEQKGFNDENFVPNTTDYYEFTINRGNNIPDIKVRYSITNGRDTGSGWLKSGELTANKMYVESVAYIPGGSSWLGMKENVYAQRTSLFMYQIFFENDLEIAPGPTFNLTGLIHTNEDMYLNSNSTLNIYTDSLTAAGNIYRGRLDSSSVGGTVNITKKDQDGDLVEMGANNDSENESWTDVAEENWGGTVKDKSLGATRQETPSLQSFEPGGYYDTNAGISIKVDTSGANPVYKISVDGGSPVTYTEAQLGGALNETLVYDYREHPSGSHPSNNTPVKVTNVDIKALEAIIGHASNGTVYMTRDDSVLNTANSGFKLVNSSTLNDATTFVSDLPVYIQGDFNKHTSADPTTDTWKPCAVVADAITLLSNSWDNAKSNWKDHNVNPSLSMPSASNTEYDFVMITGNVPTQGGQYSGGLENFPRFLEKWSGKSANIKGGFIQLFRSKYATGKWSYGKYYKAPIRNWGSEPRFSNLNDLPPEFVNMFPSTSIKVIYSNWKLINKSESLIGGNL